MIQPTHWPKPKGYVNAIAAQGETLYLAGQVAFDDHGVIIDGDFVAQFARALANVVTVLRAGDAAPTDVVRMTIYVTDLAAYRAAGSGLRDAWRASMGRHYPAMALVGVAGLVEPRAMVEIEATAVRSLP
ncbi:MAG: RidA family protein [Deltaproteobacteria bacterium]|nr:RidA family protein [Deltaproteobacteria bacterium]